MIGNVSVGFEFRAFSSFAVFNSGSISVSSGTSRKRIASFVNRLMFRRAANKKINVRQAKTHIGMMMVSRDSKLFKKQLEEALNNVERELLILTFYS